MKRLLMKPLDIHLLPGIIILLLLTVIGILFNAVIDLKEDNMELTSQLNHQERTNEDLVLINEKLHMVLDNEAERRYSLRTKLIKEIDTAERQITRLESELQEKKKPFKPKLGLTDLQNELCLAIALHTEVEGEWKDGKEVIAWAIVNRSMDPRSLTGKSRIYKNNVCATSVASKQFSGMGPYITDINDVVWGNITDFTPANAKKNELVMKSWLETKQIAKDLIAGKLTRKTTANHFISFRGMRNGRIPSWVGDIMPVPSTVLSGLHVTFRDYGYDRKTGDLVYFTKALKYNPMLHKM